MEDMDIDTIYDVPDTPERLTMRMKNSVRNGVEDEGTKDHPLVIDSGGNKSIFRVPKSTRGFNRSVYRNNTEGATGSSHTRGLLFERPSSHSMPSFSSSQNERPVFGIGEAKLEKRSVLSNGTSCSHDGPQMNSTLMGNPTEGTRNVSRVGSTNGFQSLKQKRLVRNGCISPNNLAKTKKVSEEDVSGSVAPSPPSVLIDNFVAEYNNSLNQKGKGVALSTPSVLIDNPVAEFNNSRNGKGKGVVSQSKEPDTLMKDLAALRSSISLIEEATGTNDYNGGVDQSVQDTLGWISTHNHHSNLSFPSSETRQFVTGEMNPPRHTSQHHANRIGRRDKETSVDTGDDHSTNLNSLSSRQSQSNPRPHSARLNGHRSAANTLLKKQRQGSTSRSFVEPEVVFHSPSLQPSTSRSISNNIENLQQVIELDDSSPEMRHHNANEEAARARQLEADERLAHALQEQLYNEGPDFGAGEFDAQYALAFENQEEDDVFDSRESLISDLNRQTRSRSSYNAPRRGSSQSRASNLGRMTRLRSRFPGHMLPPRERASLFPADMDVDMRMHILGALEAFSEISVGPGILQTQRDFNENDYEMLLALDENNDQHSGASIRQINGLPQSTVQSENFEEPCAVCLENPSIGDTIRHLPCLHKFHKDCIDPWLRRKTSCPVCKSSIT